MLEPSTTIHAEKSQWLSLVLPLVVIVLVVLGIYIDHLNRAHLVNDARQEARNELSVLRVKLEGVINANIQTVRGLSAVISNHPEIQQSEFEQIARRIVESNTQIKNIGAAPDMVLSMIYPLKGNEKALGLNYLTHPQQRDQAVLARDSRQMVIAGPLNLVQGGVGLIARIPVVLGDEDTRSDRFWGLLSVVIDMEKVYQEVGLSEFDNTYHLSLSRLGHGMSPQVFYGEVPALRSGTVIDDYIQMDIRLPNADWQLSAIPVSGWVLPAAKVWFSRLVVVLVIAMSIALLLLLVRWSRQQASAGAKIQQSRDQFAALVRHMPGITYRCLAHDQRPVIFVSEQVEKITGFDVDAFISGSQKTLTHLIHPDDRESVSKQLAQALRTKSPWQISYRIVTQSGDTRYVLDKGVCIYDAVGIPDYLDGLILDVTEKTQAELAANEVVKHNQILAEVMVSQELLEGRFEPAKKMLATKMSAGLDVSRASIWLFSKDKSRVECAVLYERDRDRFSEGMVIRNEDAPAYFDALVRDAHVTADNAHTHPATRDFSETYLKPLNICSLIDIVIPAGKEVIGVMCAEQTGKERQWTKAESAFVFSMATMVGSLVVSERRDKAEKDLIKARDEAEAAARIKSDFLATMSHEIRTPMNGVLGMLNALNGLRLSEDQAHYVSVAKNSAAALLHIIDDILDFSKVDAGKLKLDVHDFDLDILAQDVMESVQWMAEEKGLDLIYDSRNLLVQRVAGDSHRIRQILTNLLGNAIKFTSEGRILLELASHAEAGNVCVSITLSDTGVGIEEQHLDGLFEAFHQADTSTTREFGGTGLGLAIVKKLSEAMGGTVAARSRVGQGSEFRVSLKLSVERNETPVSPLPDLQGKRIGLGALSPERRTIITHYLALWGAKAVLLNIDEQSNGIDVAGLDLVVSEFSENHQFKDMKSDPAACDVVAVLLIRGLHSMSTASRDEQEEVSYLSPCFTREALAQAIQKALSQTGSEEPTGQTEQEDTSIEESSPLLVVEDNNVNQLVVKTMLGQLGYDCDIAVNGREALDMLAGQDAPRYGLILMDCQMPEMDGYEATREIRRREAENGGAAIPIVALTANAMREDQAKCRAAGMDDYLAKPLDPEALKAKLGLWLSRAGCSEVSAPPQAK